MSDRIPRRAGYLDVVMPSGLVVTEKQDLRPPSFAEQVQRLETAPGVAAEDLNRIMAGILKLGEAG